MSPPDTLELRDGLGTFRPAGRYSLVDAVDLVSQAIACCRDRGVDKLLVNARGFVDLPMPSLIDRFLMVEDWAREAEGTVLVAMVAAPEYVHPQKFGVTVALHFGLICNVHTSEEEALEWLAEAESDAARFAGRPSPLP